MNEDQNKLGKRPLGHGNDYRSPGNLGRGDLDVSGHKAGEVFNPETDQHGALGINEALPGSPLGKQTPTPVSKPISENSMLPNSPLKQPESWSGSLEGLGDIADPALSSSTQVQNEALNDVPVQQQPVRPQFDASGAFQKYKTPILTTAVTAFTGLAVIGLVFVFGRLGSDSANQASKVPQTEVESFVLSGIQQLKVDDAESIIISPQLVADNGLQVNGNAIFSDLVNCDTLDTNATGQLICGDDGGGVSITETLVVQELDPIIPLTVSNGGTGLQEVAAGSLLFGTGGDALDLLGIGAANSILTSNGSVPQWVTQLVDSQISNTLTASLFVGSGSTTNAIDLGTAEVNGVLGATNGGTGLSTVSTGDILFGSDTDEWDILGIGGEGDCLNVTGGLPIWGSCAGTGVTLQAAYNNSATPALISTISGKNIRFDLADNSTFELSQSGTSDILRVNDDGTFSDTTPFVIDAGGNVGIGDSTPIALLTVGSGGLFQIASNGNVTTTNGNTWTFGGDTNFVASGGINGFSVDGTTFSVDATNNRIGIGTVGPSSALHVVGNARVTGLISCDTIDTDASGNLMCGSDSTGGGGGGGATNLQEAYEGGNTINVTSSQGNLIVNLNSSDFITTIADDSTNFVTLQRADGSGTNSPAQLLLLSNEDSDLIQPIGLTIQAASGGMQTAIDLSDSDIVDAINIGSNNIVTTGATISESELNLLDGHDVALVDTNDAVSTAITGVGTLTTGTWNATVIGAIYGGTGQTAVATGDLLYGSAANTWSRLAGGGDGTCLKMSGTTPAWSSSCAGGSGTGGSVTLQDAYNASSIPATITTADGKNLRITLQDTTTDQTFEITQAGTADIIRINDDGTYTDTTPIVISHEGRLGIGLTSPSSILHVSGISPIFQADNSAALDIALEHTTGLRIVNADQTNGNSSAIKFQDISSGGTVNDIYGEIALLYAGHGAGTESGEMIFSIRDGGIAKEVIRLADGNLGVGDSSPAALFTVGSGDLFQVASNGNLTSSNAGTWTFSNDTNFVASGGVNGFSIDGTTFSVDATNNRIGIGTASPGFSVDTNLGSVSTNTNIGYNVFADATSNIGFAGYNLQLNNTTANASAYLQLARTSSSVYVGLELGSQSRDGLRVLTGAVTPTEVLRVTAAGNVGIGDASPTALLTVGSGDLLQVSSAGQLLFNGVTTDITTGTNQDLTVVANGTGQIVLNDTVRAVGRLYAETSIEGAAGGNALNLGVTTDTVEVNVCRSSLCDIINLANDGADSDIIALGDSLDFVGVRTSTNLDFALEVAGHIGPSMAPSTTTVSKNTNDTATADSDGAYSSVAIGADGFPVISYNNASDGGELAISKCSDRACSAAPTRTEVTVTDSEGQYTSIAIGADGLPVISHANLTDSDVVITKCSNTSCTSNTSFQIVDADSGGIWTDIAIGKDGLPIVVYRNTTNGNVEVVKCGNAACTSGNTLTEISTANTDGFENSIAIGADGLPVITTRNGSDGDLNVIKCNDTACAGNNETITEISTSDSDGQYSSIAIGTDGLPVISHYNITDDALNVVKCGNAACSSGNQINEPDSFFGEYTSITISREGNPIISSMDTISDKRVVTHCGDEACSSGNVSTSSPPDSTGISTSIAIGTDGLPVVTHQNGTDLEIQYCADNTCDNSSGSALTTGVDLGSITAPMRSLYFDTINLGRENAPLWLNENGTLIVRDLQVLNCSGCGGSGDAGVTVRKATNESSAARGSTLTDDSELKFYVGANETWEFEFTIAQNFEADSDLKFAVGTPSGATCNYTELNYHSGGMAGVNNTTCSTTTTILSTGDVANHVMRIKGSIINGSTPGIVSYQWAENTNSTNFDVLAGSTLVAHRQGGSTFSGGSLQSGGLGSRIVRKPINETTNTTSVQHDDHLSFFVGANETWTFNYLLMANVGGSSGIRYDIEYPSGATCTYDSWRQTPTHAGENAQVDCATDSAFTPSSTSDQTIFLKGSIANGSTPGNVTVRWQNNSGAQTTTVKAGSLLEAFQTGVSAGGGTLSLQEAYYNGGSITTGDAQDITITLADTASTDSNFIINVPTGSTGKFSVQGGGSDVFVVDPDATHEVTLSRNQNGTTSFNVTNTTNGSSAFAQYRLQADTATGFLASASSAVSEAAIADRIILLASSDASGLLLSTEAGSGDIRLHTGGTTSSTTERLRVTSSGNVGIGTASPNFLFSAFGALPGGGTAAAITNTNTVDASTRVALRINLGTATTGVNSRFITFFAGSTTDANGTGVGRIRLNNGNVAYETGGADFGEWFKAVDGATTGEIVSVASDGAAKAVNGTTILGVVSDQTGFVGNAKTEIPGPDDVVVGMLGQIKTKVKGNIATGDPIKASDDTPGVGEKAVGPGQIVGYAIGSHTGDEIGEVLVYVNPTWHEPSTGSLTQGTGNFSELNVSGLATVEELKVTGTAIVADLVIEGHIIGNEDTRGEVTIMEGRSEVEFIFDEAYDEIPYVVVSPVNRLVLYRVESTEEGFTIHLEGPAPADTKFNYFVQQ